MMNDWEQLKIHEEAINNILKGGYQTLIGKHVPYLKQGLNYIDHIKGLKVLDAGSNHGIMSLVASKFCPEVVGVEHGKDGHDKGLELLEYFKKVDQHEYNANRVRLLNCGIGDIYEQFDGVIAYNILYHLQPKDLDRMTEIISQCSKIIVQARKKARGTNDLHKPDLILRYLSGLGFQCEVKEPKSPRPIIWGTK